jgi:hypothetical protein
MVIAMNTYALIESGVVTNMVIWDGNTATWSPPEGAQAVATEDGDGAQIGATYDGSKFIAPEVQPAEAPGANG